MASSPSMRGPRSSDPVPPTGMTADHADPGERLARVARRSTCRLTHYGRKSGERHEVTLWFVVDGERVYLVTADRRRRWVQNVLARPVVQRWIGSETFQGEAEPITRPADMAHVLGLLARIYWLARLYLWRRRQPDAAFRVRVRD